MPKKIIRQWDHERTALLNHEDLSVERGNSSETYFYVWNRDYASGREKESCCCPFCGSVRSRNQGLFSKTYLDLIQDEDGQRPVTLQYQFYKYICLDCRHTFAPEITFASRNDRVTYRVEDEIVRLVTEGCSYQEVSDRLQGAITRQAVGQIFHRWVSKRDKGKRIKQKPRKLAIITADLSDKREEERCTLMLNLDDGVRVYNILYGVSTGDITREISEIGPENIETVLSDCDPVVCDVIQDKLPSALHIIPVEYWFDFVSNDFKGFAHEHLRWCTVRGKDELIMEDPTLLGYRTSNLETLMKARPEMERPYNAYNDLRRLISRQDEMWIFAELEHWVNSLDEAFRHELDPSIMQLMAHREEIEAHVRHREEVPYGLHEKTDRLKAMLSELQVYKYSPSILKSKILYENPDNMDDWRGVLLENVS